MTTSIDLLHTAMKREPDTSNAEWGRRMFTDRTAVNTAIRRKHLSPVMAGSLAMYLNEPVEKWMALAALEKSTPHPDTEKLRRVILRVKS
ncbi:UNVERIFIED_ORG: hypothetical protein ABIC43_004694 [Variovorax guangxiensis]